MRHFCWSVTKWHRIFTFITMSKYLYYYHSLNNLCGLEHLDEVMHHYVKMFWIFIFKWVLTKLTHKRLKFHCMALLNQDRLILLYKTLHLFIFYDPRVYLANVLTYLNSLWSWFSSECPSTQKVTSKARYKFIHH